MLQYILMCLPKVYKTLLCAHKIVIIIVRCKLFFLFIGWEPTTWPAGNGLQIMVCSCAISSNCVWLQRIFCSCVNESALFSFLQSLLPENGSFPKKFIKKRTWWLFIINNCYWTRLSQNIVICQINHLPSASASNWSARHWQIPIFCPTSSNIVKYYCYLISVLLFYCKKLPVFFKLCQDGVWGVRKVSVPLS